MTTDRILAGRGRVVVLACVAALVAGRDLDARAASGHNVPRVVRKVTQPRLAFVDPLGLAFSARANAFFVMPAQGASTVQVLSHTADPAGMEALNLPGADPLNAAFDEQGNRLLVLAGRRLFAISARPDGRLEPGAVAQFDVAHLGLQSPSGMVVDAGGIVFILERSFSRLVRVEPSPDGGFEAAAVSYVDLLGVPGETVQGLARNPGSGNLFMLGGRRELYETSATGELLRTYSLAGAGLKKPGGLTFAPTGDLTDDPSAQNLYVADGSPSAAQKGSIVELSFATTAATTAAVTSFTSSVVNTVLTSRWSPPAPDTSDVVYMPATNTLRVVDSEVDEMSIWKGANEWEATLDGMVLDKASLTSFSSEPTGVSVNPANQHLFYSDDSKRKVFELDPGRDGQYHTSDDVLTSFSTSAFSSTDPEDVTYDPLEGVIYLADGLNREVYRISPGANGRFDGVPSAGDDVVTHFDTSTFAQDPECLTVNTDTNHLYIGGSDDTIIQEISTTGTLLRTINISAASARNIGGIGFGPGSSDPAARRLYLVQRGTDNDSNPNENDGKLWELTLPADGPVNQAPVVTAGADQAVTLPALANLDGTVSDDGLPNPPGAVTTTWSTVSGPGTVSFGNVNAVDTTASFSVAGTYVLRLTASDSVLSSSDDVTIAVSSSGPANQAPTANAGLDQSITLPSSATLDGTVSDDGLPNPPGILTTTWSKLSGPGNVTFGNASAVDTTASFSVAGTYVLRLTASDGQFSASDDVTLTVAPAPGQGVLDVAVSASTDDAEEYVDGTISRTSSDLELVYATDGVTPGNQTVGIRFVNLAVPSGAAVLNAYVQFTVDETTSEPTTLTIQGEGSDNAPTFGSTIGSISARPRTSALVSWSPPAWTTVGAAGPEQRVDVTLVIDEIVHRAGWASGNALALIIQGTGKRVARAFDFGVATAPKLHVEYTTQAVNRAPVVTITAPANGSTHTQGTSVGFAGSAEDAEDGDVTTSLVWSSSVQGQIGSGGSFSRSDLVAGSHTITATATDSGMQTGSAEITLTIQPTGSFSTEVRVASSADDAEERASTSVSFTGSDLELVYATESGAAGNQTVGLRFVGLGIPQGATITNAYVQFTCDEAKSALTELIIGGQASDDAPPFVKALGNVSTRPRTLAVVLWSPAPWNTVGLAGPDERTPDLSSVIQQIVDRPGWSANNALALIVSGTGVRTARSFNFGAAVAPLLHVDFTVP